MVTDEDLPYDTLNCMPFSGTTKAGTAQINSDGTFSYSHNGERIFADSIPLTVIDAAGHITTGFVVVKIIPAKLNGLSMKITPLSGVIPDSTAILSSMTEQISPTPSMSTGTICDVQLNRFVEQFDLNITVSILDVVGNEVTKASFGEMDKEIKIGRHESGELIRLFWSGRNSSGRTTGAGTYLLKVQLTDRFNGESIESTALWGTKRAPIPLD